ncbi:hypothetical protein Hypma_001852 [Hypsizygus marmoreus]|uniref:Uncharacterized protein n=1 Tax=Hypsizygus marmoreus TaxID=39966 RepID=A0A369J7J7_HYPMA|nr:hypothetical protein Hypma_001852 [Hypsizygus marmoreus]
METKRAQTLEALEAFIQAQRALLTRTQSDITRLEKLRKDAVAQPADFVSNFAQELNDSAFRLSDQYDAQLSLPRTIDWSVYDAHDPKPLQTLAGDVRRKYAQRRQPRLYQHSELSDLQKLVKNARRTIVDPVLALFEYMSEPEDEPEEKIDPEEARREREREKLRELKRRKIQTWGGLMLPSRERGSSGVFIRHDVDDESLEVDITLDDRTTHDSTAMDVDTPSTTVIPPTHGLTAMPRSSSQAKRIRVPSKKLKPQNGSLNQGSSALKPKPRPAKYEADLDAMPSASNPRGTGKPKPETYKQAWSVSEQHLLEQLLDQIPDGEKNRWQKISRAMDGRRTPRQVASRVQKYFEKLKRFGLGMQSGDG